MLRLLTVISIVRGKMVLIIRRKSIISRVTNIHED